MVIKVLKKGEVIAEVNGQKAAAEYLGVTVGKVAYMVRYGREYNGVILQSERPNTKSGEGVLAITEKEIFLFASINECAEAYGLSRRQLSKLIDTGGTADDGYTTFDIAFK